MPARNSFLFHNGYEEGNAYPAGSRNLPPSIIVGSQLLHAVGIGYAMKLKGEADAAAVSFFGDGATSQGDFHEALNFAAVWQAPVVFLCQNNQWAISLPVKKQTRARSLAQKAIAYEMPGIQVDGNDVLGVYRATREALDRAHRGEGPTLIEAVTYRLLMHTTSDDPTRYRTEAEVEAWRKKDPIPRYRAYLEHRGLLTADAQKALEESVRAEVERAVQELEAFGTPAPDAPFDHVFATPPPGLEAQRQEFLAAIKREAGHG
jgi:pyruvate dehydrogenase E1 component alpha subunit